jgi:Rieske 2Fe-2S family protein
VFILRPRSPTRTDIVCHFLFEPFELAKADFDPGDAVEFWDLVNRQDWSICESVQQGISAWVHERGYYAPMEDFNLDIRRYVLDRIGDAVAET